MKTSYIIAIVLFAIGASIVRYNIGYSSPAGGLACAGGLGIIAIAIFFALSGWLDGPRKK